jgi:transcriptional regulator with XRE-family HTH domain
MGDLVPLGQRLRERREELGISQAQAARELDVARTAYRLWELEAARPHADRWRVISRWLGISVAALLLAEELTQAGESDEADRIAVRLQELGADLHADPPGATDDYFTQERATIAKQEASGSISPGESARLRSVLERIEGQVDPSTTSGWRSAAFHKELEVSSEAVEQARAAFLLTASGLPTSVVHVGEQLVERLMTDAVADSVQHGVIVLRIECGRRTLRVDMTDRPDPEASGTTVALDQASRWGGSADAGVRTRWFEFDLPEPGEHRD